MSAQVGRKALAELLLLHCGVVGECSLMLVAEVLGRLITEKRKKIEEKERS